MIGWLESRYGAMQLPGRLTDTDPGGAQIGRA